MLRLTAFEFFVRTIPESFVMILAMIALCNIKIDMKKYIMSSSLLAVYVYCGRMLPINYGVHTILDIFIMIVIMCFINKADVILAIKSSLITTIVLYILEGFNVLILNLIFKDQLEAVMSNTVQKEVYGLPSIICFALITILYYLKKRMHRYV